MTKGFITITDLNVSYGRGSEQLDILRDVNLTLAAGEINVLIGPSGCGKSTLLNILAGLNSHYQGQVLIDGRQPQAFSDTSLILQDYGLLPWKTVWENVILGLQIRKQAKKIMAAKAQQVLEQLGLYHLAGRYPLQLSGGQRQRIAIARSLVLEPRLLLMDEPFSSLDALTREEMQTLLLEIWTTRKLTILLVTHNIEEAAFLGHNILLMTSLPGTIKEQLQNPLAARGSNRGTSDFLQLANHLRQGLYEVMHHVHG